MTKFKISNDDERISAIKKLESLPFLTTQKKSISYRVEVVKNIKKKMTNLSYYWIVIDIAAKKIGCNKEDLNEVLRVLFLEKHKEEKENFFKVVTALEKSIVLKVSLKDIKEKSLLNFIEFSKRYFRKRKIIIPDIGQIGDYYKYDK